LSLDEFPFKTRFLGFGQIALPDFLLQPPVDFLKRLAFFGSLTSEFLLP